MKKILFKRCIELLKVNNVITQQELEEIENFCEFSAQIALPNK